MTVRLTRNTVFSNNKENVGKSRQIEEGTATRRLQGIKDMAGRDK